MNADGFHVYSYDVEGKITQIDSGAVTMTYDALGRWVERGAGGGFTQRIFSPAGRELALTSGQTVATAYVPLPGGALVRYNSSGLDSYWHPDWLGTARLYSNTARAVVNEVAYAPFGEWYINGPADSFFTGVAQSDAAADMKAFLARDYHTTQGRWLIPDPAGLQAVDLANPQTLNRYAYVMNDPLANVDPTGMDACFTYYTVNNGDGPTFIASTTCYTTIPAGQDPRQLTYGNRGGTQTGGSGPGQPPKSGAQQSCAVQRLAAAAKGLASLGVAAAKIDLAAESALSIPVTGPLGAVGAAYGAIGASGNIAAGGLQLVGAATGNLRTFGEAANVATTLTTVGGFTVSLATRGNMEAASMAASFESLGTAGVNGGMTGHLIDQGATLMQKVFLSTELGQSIADALGLNTGGSCH